MVGKRKDSKGRVLPPGVTEREDGRYMARITLNGKTYTAYDKDLNIIKKKLVQMQSNAQNGNFIEIESITLNSWFEKWLKIYKEDKLKPLTLSNYKKYWERYIENTIGNMKISKLKRVHIIQLYNEYLERRNPPLAFGTIKYVNNLLYSSLEQAYQNDMILKNPCSSILKELKRPETEAKQALTIEEQHVFFEFIKQDTYFKVYEPMLMIAFGTGLRIGELLSLTWKDIDFKENTIKVNKTLHYAKLTDKQEFFITTPKTKNATRAIPMLDEVKKALLRQREYQMVLKIDRTFSIDNYSDFCFTTKKGTTFNADAINQIIKSIIRKCNKQLAEKKSDIQIPLFSPHIMRHTFCSRLCENNVNIKVVQEIMGHGDIKTTMDIYTHISDQMKQDEMKVLNNIKIS